MSKKMMRRSLALGALMAFVITGQAWAETFPGGKWKEDWHYAETFTINVTEDSVLEGGIQDSNDGHKDENGNTVRDTWILNLNDKRLDSTGSIMIDGGILDINGNAGSALYMNGTLGLSGTVDVDTLNIKNGNLYTYGTSMTVTTKSLVIDNPNGSGINVQGDTSRGTIGGGITITTDYLSVTSGARALRTAREGSLNITTDEIYVDGVEESKATHKTNMIVTANKGTIDSSFVAGENGSKGTVVLTLGSGVTLTGSVVTDTAGTDDNASASTLTLNGATWDVQGDSNVTTVAGEKGNVVVNDTSHKIEIGNNSNTGLTIQASEELSEEIVSGNKKLEDIASNVDIKDGTKQVTLATKETDIAGVTSIIYDTAEDKATSGVVKQVSAKNDAISNAGMALKGHYRAHMNDMNKRMGELRMANGEAGVWTRMVRGESEYQDAKMQYNQYQLGYDEKLSIDKRWTVGAAVIFAEGDSNYGYGSTDDKSTAFAIYGTKLNNDGTFVDLIARYAHLESDIDDVKSGKGDYSTNGYSVSAEFGKRIQQGNGLWIEPQVELTYGTVDSADFRLNKTDKDIHADSMDSFIARVGFSMGKDIKQGNVYARASYLYDFDGETETSFSANGVQGDVVKEDFGGGWWEVGVGANINLSKATYIYADIEKTFGGEVDTNWQWNLGIRYSF